jgi:pilus assembly protein CpaE
MERPRMTRIVVIDPDESSRRELEQMLAALGTVQLLGPVASYQDAERAGSCRQAELAVVGLDANPAEGIRLVQHLARSGTPVLPASHSRDGSLILQAIRAGAREFLTLPATAAELAEILPRVAQPATEGPGSPVLQSRLIAVLGAAGGVGCTTVATNLATCLARDPAREVVLVDLDLILGAVDACLDLVPDQTLADVAGCVDRLDLTLLKRALSRHDSGLYVLPGAATLEEAAKIDHEAIRRVLEKLQEAFPIVVTDLSKSLQACDFAALELAETILLVVQLEPACLRNATRLMALLRSFDGLEEKVKIVANRVGSTSCDIGPKKAEELLKRPVSCLITNDTKTFALARARGVPVETVASGSHAHRDFLALAGEFGATGQDRARSRFGRLAASFF